MCCNNKTKTPKRPQKKPETPACQSCAQPCTCTAGRQWVFARKAENDIVAVRAKIKTRYGKICCESHGSTDNGYHVAYVNVLNGAHWAQCGWGRARNHGSTTIVRFSYTEIKAPVHKRNFHPPPDEGSVHEYRCDLDSSTGTWSYSQDGTPLKPPLQGDAWKDKKGLIVQYVGEIWNKEDDLPGTAADKCSFTDCQYQVDGGVFKDAAFGARDMRNGDDSEWGIDLVSGTAFDIWDKKPLP